MSKTETRLPVLILDWLRDNGRGTSPRIAQAIGRDSGLVNASLRQAERSGAVRRVGEEPNPKGRAATIYELAQQYDGEALAEQLNDGEVPEMDTATMGNGAEAAGRTTLGEMARHEPDQPVADHDTPEGTLSADELRELIGGYCTDVKLSEATTTTLRTALAVAEAIEQLEDDDAPLPEPMGTTVLQELLNSYCGDLKVSDGEATTLRFVLKVRSVIEAAGG